jgi:hypothetical protein
MRRRRRRMDRSSAGDVLVALLELSEGIWAVLKFAVRIPALLLRLLS